jgi:glutamine cyclotransferase
MKEGKELKMKTNHKRFPLAAIMVLAIVVGFTGASALATDDAKTKEDASLKAAVQPVEDYKTPGIEAELSGFYPHPTNSNLYYLLTNKRPPYRYGQKPMLAEKYLGKLLTVDKRTGEVVASVKIADDDFGGLVFAEGFFYAATTNGSQILKLDPANFKVLAKYPLPSPAGGLGYDKERGVLIAQLYVEHPNLAVVDLKTGKVTANLWSDESAMGLAKIDGDWLCTWASGWDPGSFSELRVIDQQTGKVRSRIRMEGVHSVLSPIDGEKNAFLCMITVDAATGRTIIRKYTYTGEQHRSSQASNAGF